MLLALYKVINSKYNNTGVSFVNCKVYIMHLFLLLGYDKSVPNF